MHLRAKFSLSLAGMLSVAVLSAAWLFWISAREEIRAGAANQLFSLVSYAAEGIDNDLTLAIATARAVAAAVPAEALRNADALKRHMALLPMPMGAIHRCIAV